MYRTEHREKESSKHLSMPRISLRINGFEGVQPKHWVDIPVDGSDLEDTVCIDGSEWRVESHISPLSGQQGVYEGEAIFTVVSGQLSNGNVAVRLDFERWSMENYVLMPGAAYDGNRFRVIPKKYPPMLHHEDGIGEDMPITITDVPHLKKEQGYSRLHLRSGDMATPCIGIQNQKQRKAFFLLGDHYTPFGYTGWLLEESETKDKAYLQLEVPAVREKMYIWSTSEAPSDDQGYSFKTGDRVTLRFRIYDFECDDINAFYDKFFTIRKDLSGTTKLHHMLPFSEAFRIIEEKYLESQWNENCQYLMVAPHVRGKFEDWQAGWVGGAMNSYAFLFDGSALSKERGKKTLDAVFGKLQTSTGFICPIQYKGSWIGDDFDNPDDIDVLLIRKNADVLLFAARHILLLEKRKKQIPCEWLQGFKRLADAFVRLWDRYGQFGQFINMTREEILIGGTSSAGTAPGGLALASQILKDNRYLDTAIESARYYYYNFVCRGVMNGGPGEILQCPDSESAFGLLESYITLYEVTGQEEWLPIAEDCARQCASWCVSYDFEFPKDSVFGKLDMHTTGSVYANVQNKHSAPGICTLSGVSLLKLYRATGNRLYLDLCQEIAHNITQYLSREDRPILSWDDGKYLPPGWMCERVNMSDWEGKDKIGEVFYGSCWCEVSCLLTYVEIPGVWILSDTGEVITFDHVDSKVVDKGDKWSITLKNPTAFDASTKVYIERRADFSNIWGECALEGCKIIEIPAGNSTTFEIRKE